MTKQIVAVLALSLISSSAFASQAKNLVTGGGDKGLILGASGLYGSFYTNDDYNMFYNPAFINGQKNWAIVENQAGNAGFVTGMGAYNVGVFFNRAGNSAVTNGGQNIDVLVGGDMGVKWGFGLHQSLSQNASNPAATTTLKAGVVVADFEPFVSYDLKNTTGTVESNDMTVGTRYHYGDWTPYVAYRTVKAVSTQANAQTHMGLGVGRMAKMGDIHMDYAVSYWSAKLATDVKGYVVPVNVTFSADAASWLTVRAGFAHDLRGKNLAGTITQASGTTLGGTFHLGKADLDMVVGDTGANGQFGFDQDLFANAGLTYRW